MMDKYSIEKEKLLKLAISQQQEAANPRKSVWVEASAGTGKTKILSDRVLRLLLKKIDPAKLLCLTYTKAAAVEMNERIAKGMYVLIREGSACPRTRRYNHARYCDLPVHGACD